VNAEELRDARLQRGRAGGARKRAYL